MEKLPINAETVNKSIDIIDQSTKETRKELDKTASKVFHKLAELLWASPIGIKADVYIKERPYKLQKALEEMQAKYDSIPPQYQSEPSSYIALKCINELGYCLDEEHLKEMFQNILLSDMDSRKRDKVLPSYIEIVKQLSKEDAEFLKLIYEHGGHLCSIILNIETEGIDGSVKIDKYAIYNYKKHNSNTIYSTLKLDNLVIDNLIMHRLIENTYDTYYTRPTAEKEYNTLFDSVKNNYELDENQSLSFDKGIICLTDLGKNFINICLS